MSWITHQPAKNFASVLCISFLLSACGGGGNGGSSTSSNNNTETNAGTETPTEPAPQTEPEPPAVLPVFTSPATISIKENEITVLSVSSSIPATFSLTGGADQDKFNITGSDLSFKDAPNFEKASDQNTDNTYEVEITATENGKSASQLLSVVITNVLPPIIFPADDGINGLQLWTTDGTETGTKLLKKITPEGGGFDDLFNSYNYTSVEELVFFIGFDGTSKEIWVTDGTEEGTNIVKKINPSGPSIIQYPAFSSTAFNGEFYFTASDGINGHELWKSDGTEEGTKMVKDINPGSGDSSVNRLSTRDNSIIFSAYSPDVSQTNPGLWISDGTEAGTQPILDHQGNSVNPQSEIITLGEYSYFSSNVGETFGFYALWETDGTAEGTSPIEGLIYTDPSNPIVFDNKVFVTSRNQSNSILMYDPNTEEGLYQLSDTAKNVGDFTVIENTLYFTSNYQRTLYKSDGTPEGTLAIAGETIDNSDLLSIKRLFSVHNTLLFAGNSTEYSEELWTSDGTTEGTRLLKDIDTTNDGGRYNGSNPYWFSNFEGLKSSSFTLNNGDELLLAHRAGEGHELWKTDGSSEGTKLIKDIYPGPNSLFEGN